MLERITTHVRYACRRLLKSPGFSATAILSLALGIGATTAIFSLVNAVLLRPMPVQAPDEVVEIYLATPDYEYGIFSYPDYRDLRDATEHVFSGIVASRLVPIQIDGSEDVETLIGELVSGNFLSRAGYRAVHGADPSAGRRRRTRCPSGGHGVLRHLADTPGGGSSGGGPGTASGRAAVHHRRGGAPPTTPEPSAPWLRPFSPP